MANTHESTSWFAPPEEGLFDEEDHEFESGSEVASDLGHDPGEKNPGWASASEQPYSREMDEGAWALESVESEVKDGLGLDEPSEDAQPLNWPALLPRVDEPAWALGPTEEQGHPCARMRPTESSKPDCEESFDWAEATSDSLSSDRMAAEMPDGSHAELVLSEPCEPAIGNNEAVRGVLDESPCVAEPRTIDSSLRVVRARVASLSDRGLSWLLDGAAILGLTLALVFLGGLVAGAGARFFGPLENAAVALPVILLATLLGAVYTAVSIALAGQTLGGRLTGIRILNGHGETPDLMVASARGLAAALGVILMGVGLAWVLVDDRGQALHDRLVGTFAVEV